MQRMGRPAKTPPPSYGRHLAELRKSAGLSQQQLADKMNVRQSTVASWERSANPPKGEFLAPLAKSLKVSLDTLLQTKSQTIAARHRGPNSKFEVLIDEVSKLPRRRQQRITNLLETLISQEQTS
jgi:transcriptional regulator with XRE-family HTH domain